MCLPTRCLEEGLIPRWGWLRHCREGTRQKYDDESQERIKQNIVLYHVLLFSLLYVDFNKAKMV